MSGVKKLKSVLSWDVRCEKIKSCFVELVVSICRPVHEGVQPVHKNRDPNFSRASLFHLLLDAVY
jgi:hypothetical protein